MARPLPPLQDEAAEVKILAALTAAALLGAAGAIAAAYRLVDRRIP